MKLTVNGTEHSLYNKSTVSGLLISLQIDPDEARGIAVAVNERIVRRDDWRVKTLSDGDCVEIVTAQQGG